MYIYSNKFEFRTKRGKDRCHEREREEKDTERQSVCVCECVSVCVRTDIYIREIEKQKGRDRT